MRVPVDESYSLDESLNPRSAMARKKRGDPELLRKIRDRVIEEDQRVKEEAAKAEEQDAHLDALEEVTDLSRAKIERIAAQVESEHEEKARRGEAGRRRGGGRVAGILIVSAVVLAMAVPVVLGSGFLRGESRGTVPRAPGLVRGASERRGDR